MSSAPPTKLNPHDVISSYFIGPKAENLDSFRINIKTILDELRDARNKYFENDEVPAIILLCFAWLNDYNTRYLLQKMSQSRSSTSKLS